MKQNSSPSEIGVVLITGAAKRIGREIALCMARAGWDVAVHYRHSGAEATQLIDEIRAMGRRAMGVQAELSDAVAVQAIMPAVMATLGEVRCVVNNASLFEEDRAQSFSQACLDKHMHANVVAPCLLARALYEQVPDQSLAGWASVINILDQKLANLNPDYFSYTLSKAALQTATVTLAQALAPRVRVLGIAPGLSLVSGEQTEDEFLKAHRMTPLGRASTPQDIAQAVLFAAQATAMTGSTMWVDGGQHLVPSHRDVMFLTAAAK